MIAILNAQGQMTEEGQNRYDPVRWPNACHYCYAYIGEPCTRLKKNGEFVLALTHKKRLEIRG